MRVTNRVLFTVVYATFALIVALVFFMYPVLENNYQRSMDPIRQKDVRQIVAVVREFVKKTGHLPFQELATEKPFMVFIGHSLEEEDRFANDPVLKRNATWTNASDLEALLSKELDRTVRLPRDPQKFPTFAPNVYIYFVSGNQMTVVSHLKFPTDETIKYEWRGHPFYAYSNSYEFEPGN